jgi:hypothetical protein
MAKKYFRDTHQNNMSQCPLGGLSNEDKELHGTHPNKGTCPKLSPSSHDQPLDVDVIPGDAGGHVPSNAKCTAEQFGFIDKTAEGTQGHVNPTCIQGGHFGEIIDLSEAEVFE